jgi:hypothetical protein
MERRTTLSPPAIVVLDAKEAVVQAAAALADHPTVDDTYWTLHGRLRDRVEQLRLVDDVDYSPAGEIPDLDTVTALAVARLEEAYRRA